MSGTGETTTPFLGLIKPPIGADADVWGDRLNTNADTLDTNASSHDARIAALEAKVAALEAQSHPQEAVGTVKWWPGTGATFPAGFVNCDNSLVPIATYPDLFNVIGYYWGGSGPNFALPDLRGFTLIGFDQGTGRLQGQYGADRFAGTGGAAVVTLAVAHMPPHQHGGVTDAQGQHVHNFTALQSQPGPGAGQFAPGYYVGQAATDGAGNHAHAIATDSQGGGAAHTNCQPGALGYWIVKARLL